MNTRHVCRAGAVVLSFVTVTAAHAGQTPQASGEEALITATGCIQREADYRKEHDSGRGSAGTGLGLKNEYILINIGAENPCASAGAGDAYELTGARERDLEQFVGRGVEITGTLKRAEIGTSGRPTGGFDPLGQDLKLRELSVNSFREAAAAAAPAPAPEPEPAPAPEPAPVTPEEPAPAPVGTSGAADLPSTASPLPLTGLIGLLSLGGALGLRSLRRRR